METASAGEIGRRLAARTSDARVGPGGQTHVSFCEHCEGQRFDRARVLRAVRQLRRELRASGARRTSCDHVLAQVLRTISELEIPHLDYEEEVGGTVH